MLAVVRCSVLAASSAAAQAVKLEFQDGKVHLNAQNASVAPILAEWARSAARSIVNGERIAGAPVTLELTDVPERQALDILLRGVGGYIVAPADARSPARRRFDRVCILPTSSRRDRPPAPLRAAARRRSVAATTSTDRRRRR